MRHIHSGNRHALVQLLQLGPCLLAQLQVEIAQRLVHEEHIRPADQRPPQRDALPLPAGELRGLAVEQMVDAEDARNFGKPRPDLSRRHAAYLQVEHKVLPHAHVRVERVALEHHGHIAIARVDVGEVLAVDEQPPRRRHLQPRDHAQGRRLAAAGGAKQGKELASLDLQVEPSSRRGSRSDRFSRSLRTQASWPFLVRHLTAPSVMPRTMCRCSTNTTASIGTSWITTAALRSPQRIV